MTGYLREIPERLIAFDHEAHVVVIARSQWDQVDAYDASIPTGPSAGRVYRRRAERGIEWGWATKLVDNALVCCVQCENDEHPEPREGYVDHIRYDALIVEGA